MDNRRLIKNLFQQSFILLLACLVMFISCEVKQDINSDEEIEEIILALERQALDRWAQGDPVGMSVNFAEEVTYFDDIGAQTRLDGLEEVRNYFSLLEGKINPHSYELIDPKVQIYYDVVILTLRYHTTKPDGEPGTPWKASSVYRFANGEWHVVHAHWSLVKK